MRFTNNWFRHDLSSPYEHHHYYHLYHYHLVHDGNPSRYTAPASPCCSGIKSTLVEEGPCLFSSTTVGTLALLALKTLHSPFALHQRMVYFVMAHGHSHREKHISLLVHAPKLLLSFFFFFSSRSPPKILAFHELLILRIWLLIVAVIVLCRF